MPSRTMCAGAGGFSAPTADGNHTCLAFPTSSDTGGGHTPLLESTAQTPRVLGHPLPLGPPHHSRYCQLWGAVWAWAIMRSTSTIGSLGSPVRFGDVGGCGAGSQVIVRPSRSPFQPGLEGGKQAGEAGSEQKPVQLPTSCPVRSDRPLLQGRPQKHSLGRTPGLASLTKPTLSASTHMT